ncbi:MAG: helix-turn-helix domain-containing protein [Bacteroidales bacterium]|nr:helix-turn-helix domain-containing protein [Bacteroidales bacterium]
MDLNKIIADHIRQAVTDIVKAQDVPLIRGCTNLSKFLGISASAAYSMTQLKGFPTHRIGNTTYYLKDEVIAFIRSK